METYFKNIEVLQDRIYSRSYGSPETNEYPFAIFNGKWLSLIDETGYCLGRKNINGKHFHSWKGNEIKESTFLRNTKGAQKRNNEISNEREKKIKLIVQKVESLSEVIALWKKVDYLKQTGTHATTKSQQNKLRRKISNFYVKESGKDDATWMFPIGCYWNDN